MPNVKLYRTPDSTGVGIPAEGEFFSAEDAKRLVGQGLASRSKPSKPAATPKRSKTPARPVKEG